MLTAITTTCRSQAIDRFGDIRLEMLGDEQGNFQIVYTTKGVWGEERQVQLKKTRCQREANQVFSDEYRIVCRSRFH